MDTISQMGMAQQLNATAAPADSFVQSHSMTRSKHDALAQRRDKADAMQNLFGALVVSDERLLNLVTLFARCDERGKEMIMQLATVHASFVRAPVAQGDAA